MPIARPPAVLISASLTPFESCSVTRGSEVRAERAERTHDADDRAEQTDQRRDHADVGEIDDAVVQARGDASSLGFGDLADLLEIGAADFSS